MAQVAGGGSGGGSFEVDVPTLVAGRGWLHTDGGQVASAGTAGSGGARTGCRASGVGPLGGALTRRAEHLDDTSRAMSTAVGAAGDTVASNAAVYTGADADAAEHLGAAVTSIASDFGTGGRAR